VGVEFAPLLLPLLLPLLPFATLRKRAASPPLSCIALRLYSGSIKALLRLYSGSIKAL
jgi:hypothetical protein